MEIVAVVATVLAAFICAILTPWWSQKLEERRKLRETQSDKRAQENESDFKKLPPWVQDPCIQEGVRQLFIKTFGRAPSQRELYDMLNKTIIEKHTGTLTDEDWALFMTEQNSK